MTEKKFADECLAAINKYRSTHQVSSLSLNQDLTRVAQNWANHLADRNNFEHNPRAEYKGEHLGENIAMKWSSDRLDITGGEIADQWYKEVEKYDFHRNAGSGTGHFTQLVWKGSRQLGIGRATGQGGKWIVVANFYPAGNFLGRFAENVLPPRDGKIVLKTTPALNPATVQTPTRKALDSMWSKATKPKDTPFAADDFSNTKSGQWSSPAPSSSGLTGRLFSRTTTSGGDHYATESRKAVHQETLGSGPNAVKKTVVTETVRGPDGSVKTVTTETVSSRGQQQKPFDDFSDRPTSKTTAGMGKKSWFGGWNLSSPKQATTVTDNATCSSSSSQTKKEFIDDVIRCHNKYRRQHGRVGDLRVNKDLCQVSQQWADRLAARGTLQHSDAQFKGQQIGENIACKYGTGKIDYTGEEVVIGWYGEVTNYNFRLLERSSLQPSTGHFTQVVWKGSQEIGVGKATSGDGGQVFVVCNYFPAGNVIGRYKENVFAASD